MKKVKWYSLPALPTLLIVTVAAALLCMIGVVGMLVAPWLYRKLVEKRKAEIAPEILRLTGELSQK